MAAIYVKSGAGDVSPFVSWANAAVTLTRADTVDAAGDFLYVSQSHAETQASAMTLAFAGTAANPTKIICGNDAATPPTALATTGTVTTTGNNAMSITGNLYCYGLTFNCGTTAVSPVLTLVAGVANSQRYEQCTFKLVATGASANITIGNATSTTRANVEWLNCNVSLAAAGQSIKNFCGGLKWTGGTLQGTAPTGGLFIGSTDMRGGGNRWIDSVDLSNLGANSIFDAATCQPGQRNIVRNCKLGASTVLTTGSFAVPGARVEMYNSGSGATNYNISIADYAGTMVQDIVTTYAATENGTVISWKVITSANANRWAAPFCSVEFGQVQATVGSSLTATVEFAGAAALNTDEIWLEAVQLGTSGQVLGVFATTQVDALTAGAACTSSSVTWAGSPASKQKLALFFTPQVAGVVAFRVCVGKASTTVYIDPQASIA